MKQIVVPVSIGELIDKITILRIKSKHIHDATKLQNIAAELKALECVCQEHHLDLDHALVSELQEINQALWVIEDDIRDRERAKDFGPRFVELARAVYVTNDERFRVKALVNRHFGSTLHEEKSYQPYQ